MALVATTKRSPSCASTIRTASCHPATPPRSKSVSSGAPLKPRKASSPVDLRLGCSSLFHVVQLKDDSELVHGSSREYRRVRTEGGEAQGRLVALRAGQPEKKTVWPTAGGAGGQARWIPVSGDLPPALI